VYANSDLVGPPDLAGAQAVKILIAGGFGAGKTTLVSSVSEIRPLRTEERLSELGARVDDLTGVGAKTTTTVALDFGRITVNSEVVLYLFGTPGQERFWFMWKELSVGALGAIVLADTRRLGDCFGAVDFLETRNIPFIVAVNCFDGADIYDQDEVRQALDIGAHVPVQHCDARDRGSSKQVLVRLLEYLMTNATAARGRPSPSSPSYTAP
jgi:signal recognition particle receptor subunit beta